MQSAIKTRTERLHINMCGGLIGIEYVGAGALTHRAQQSKVNAKTVIGFARSGRTEALAIIKLCLYMCRWRLATMLFLSGPPMFLHAISEFERNFNYRLTVLFKIIRT